MTKTTMTDGSPVTPGHREIDPKTGMQKGYVVLSDEERAKGFQEPVRQSYRHLTCGGVTTMSRPLAETYARDPFFYSGTFCAICGTHFPVGEDGQFVWEGTDQKVGTRAKAPVMTDSQMDAPERVWVEYGQSGPEAMVWVGGSTIGLRKLPCYILATPEALAASLEVQSLIAAELAAANAREAGLRKALEVIREWTAFPPSGRFWRNGDGTISARPMPYGAAFGSNGERDFMRQVARAALAAENQRLRDRERVLVEAGDQAAAFDRADWFWRAMDPDDCGDSPEEAINRAMVGRFCVCEIASSYSGPTRYGFIAPVLDPESDDEEFVHFATQQEAIDAAKARAALASAPAQNEGDAT